ncbi:putative leader peptide [Cellulomonas sp. H30R-01]|uniref:putative leader peptide n=1 Tax=Cellulomonas sp. H30R-01 TaxID=2704467 RepID=UPI00351B73EC
MPPVVERAFGRQERSWPGAIRGRPGDPAGRRLPVTSASPTGPWRIQGTVEAGARLRTVVAVERPPPPNLELPRVSLHLTERRAVDLRRVASALCRPPHRPAGR